MKCHAALAGCLGLAAFTTTAVGAVTLGDTVRTAGELRFTVTGESNAIYIIEGSTNLQQWQPANTNRQVAVTRTVSVDVSEPRSYYRARVARSFTAALVARSTISLEGNNIRIDSFDSRDPIYSTPDGQFDPTKAQDRGDVTVYSGLTNALTVGNAKILGKVAVGPGGTAILGPSGCVGSTAYVMDPSNAGTIQPGWLREETGPFFPDVVLPSLLPVVPTPGTVGGTSYAYVLGNGTYRLNNLNLSGTATMLVTGSATLHVTSDLSISGSGKIVVAPTGSLMLYVGGLGNISGGGIVNQTHRALGFQYYGLSTSTSVTLTGDFKGMIYAPRADVLLSAGGSDPLNLFGAIVAKTVTVNGHYQVHYDESLARLGPLF